MPVAKLPDLLPKSQALVVANQAVELLLLSLYLCLYPDLCIEGQEESHPE